MMVRKLIQSSLLAVLMAFVVVGCNENPSDPGVDGGVTGLSATSMSETSVGLSWNAFSGATSYDVSWAPSSGGTGSSGSASAVTTSATAMGLAPRTEYTFTVTPRTATGVGAASTIKWAGATRSTSPSNPVSGTTTIRLYEANSTNPSALNLSLNGSPLLTTLNPNAPAPAAKAQIGMFIDPRTGGNPTKIVIGPVYAIPEYKLSAGLDINRIDTSVYISGTTYQITSLDTWYLSAPLSTLIDPVSNVKAYEFTSASVASNQGFVVRTGSSAATYHYARVMVKSMSGSILGGTFPNRYIELEISYQEGVNLPYAKPGMRPAAEGVRATVIQ
ncbi:MAG TPA: fibronectin type III domain-containing protein [Candidatus Kapabacteria bacterium]|nr:fibronectin type III domain-containing protein [Candidatus Kapabacteria bacterium]